MFPVIASRSALVSAFEFNLDAKSASLVGVFAFWVAALIRWYEATLAFVSSSASADSADFEKPKISAFYVSQASTCSGVETSLGINLASLSGTPLDANTSLTERERKSD